MRVFSTALRAFSAVLSGSQPTLSPPAVESSRGCEVHLVVAHPAARVAQRQLLGVDDALRLVGARALKREAGEDRERVARNGAAAALLLPAAGRGHERHGACGGQQGFHGGAQQGDRGRGGAILTSAVRCLDEPCLLPRLQPGARHVADPHPLRVVADRDLGDLRLGLVGDRRDLVVAAPGDEAVAAVGAVGRPVRLLAAVDQLVARTCRAATIAA